MQLTIISGIFAIGFYLAGFTLQLINLARANNAGRIRRYVFIAGTLAVIAHAISAARVISSPTGYHFGVVQISTLIAVSISALVLASSIRKPLENLFLGLFPLAVISIIMSLSIDSSYPPTSLSAGMASHVLISILAYSFISIAAMQAGFLAYQNYQLKHGHAGGLLHRTWKCFCLNYSG